MFSIPEACRQPTAKYFAAQHRRMLDVHFHFHSAVSNLDGLFGQSKARYGVAPTCGRHFPINSAVAGRSIRNKGQLMYTPRYPSVALSSLWLPTVHEKQIILGAPTGFTNRASCRLSGPKTSSKREI